MRELGISPSDFMAIEQAPSYPAKCECLKGLQEKVKKGFKKAALRLHPDIPENRTEEKGELFRIVRQAVEEIEHLRVRPPRPRLVMHPITFSFSGSSSTSTNTTTTSTGPGFIRINIL
jgi:hypothetical protein